MNIKKIRENLNYREPTLKEKAISTYRKYCHLGEGDKITRDNLDDHWVNAVSTKYFYDKNDLIEDLISGEVVNHEN